MRKISGYLRTMPSGANQAEEDGTLEVEWVELTEAGLARSDKTKRQHQYEKLGIV
jgi:hypothetical protein